MKKSKIIMTMFALMLCMGAFCVPALAAEIPDLERLVVDTAWTDGEVLHIEVRDTETGAVSAVELSLTDYTNNAETITIQAVDEDGNKSGVITITNPFYIAPNDATTETAPPTEDAPENTTPSISAIPDGSAPFTPDGTGTVVDNMTEQNGKEFFTITTENENTFYLVVDRQKTAENVYLLGAVTEDDLMALAEKGDGTTQSAVPEPEPTPPVTLSPEPSPEPAPEPQDSGGTGGGTGGGTIIFIVLAVVAVGGAGYYFKIVKPKRAAPDDADDDYNDYEDDPDQSDDYDETEEGIE